eukprot:gb/GECH01011918.1/.p1 GENE.gb/GECH01011918.1/~~gb/GECH01011918.1/.p1  ORF type:complete len:215 (+),score=47.58 gb/GECH01011918.1/:1-645(+)
MKYLATLSLCLGLLCLMVFPHVVQGQELPPEMEVQTNKTHLLHYEESMYIVELLWMLHHWVESGYNNTLHSAEDKLQSMRQNLGEAENSLSTTIEQIETLQTKKGNKEGNIEEMRNALSEQEQKVADLYDKRSKIDAELALIKRIQHLVTGGLKFSGDPCSDSSECLDLDCINGTCGTQEMLNEMENFIPDRSEFHAGEGGMVPPPPQEEPLAI